MKMKKYNINQSPLYKLKNQRKLEELLKLRKYDINSRKKWMGYTSFQKEKTDATYRVITTPNNKLKKVQGQILKWYTFVQRPEWLISGEKGKSYIDNAKWHQEGKYVITADISKFYDNCTREYVFNMFKDVFRMSSDVAGVMADLTTVNGGIPTGAPTSQLTAYYAYEHMFKDINRIAQEMECKFSLYVDDMTFSSNKPIDTNRLKREVDIVLRKYGHRLKERKFRYYSKRKHKLVTGVVISPQNKLVVANRQRYNIIKNLRDLKDEVDTTSVINQLKGRLCCASSVEEEIFKDSKQILSKLEQDKRD